MHRHLQYLLSSIETKSAYLIFTADQKVRSAYLDISISSSPFEPKDNKGSPLAVDFDFEKKVIFYSDGLKRAVFQVNTTSSNSEILNFTTREYESKDSSIANRHQSHYIQDGVVFMS